MRSTAGPRRIGLQEAKDISRLSDASDDHDQLSTTPAQVTFTFMELCIEGHPTFHAEGTVTVELPPYMKVLSPEELEVVRTSPERDVLIFAAGRHPKTQEIVFMTGAGELRNIDTALFKIPSGAVWPKQGGTMLRIEIELDDFDGIDVETTWALRASQLLINLGTMTDKRGARVTYVDE